MAPAAWATTHPSIPPGQFAAPVQPAIQPPRESTLGNDLTSVNDTLARLNGTLGMILDRIRGPRPEQPGCEGKYPGEPTIQLRLSHAGHAAEKAEVMAKEIIGLLGE